jgi:hypothetical protein
MVVGGVPAKRLHDIENRLLVPDLSQRVIYDIGPTRITAKKLDVKFTELDRRKVAWPNDIVEDFNRISQPFYRAKGYLLEHPLGFTHGDTLYLFAISYHTNTILWAKTASFSTSPAENGGARVASAKAGSPQTTLPDGEPMSLPDNDPPESNILGLPRRVVEGQELALDLTGSPGSQYALVNGPQGMTIEGSKLVWKSSLVRVGRHDLKIRVTAGAKIAFHRWQIEVIDKDLVARAGGSLDKVDEYTRLPLEPDHYYLAPGLNYESLLLLQGETLQQLGADGITVKTEHTLPGRYRQIAEREESWVALSKEPPAVDIINKQSLKVTKRIAIAPRGVQVMDVIDLALHPRKKTCYVTIKHDVQPPRYRVVVVNEGTGSVSAPDTLIGTWVVVDSAGNWLYTGYRDIYERGSRFHLNPGWQIVEVPQYGGIDWLMAYSLRGSQPALKHVVPKAGGNGNGIRLSPDGKRLVYLSATGYPAAGGNLVAFNTSSFKAEPEVYPTAGITGAQMFAFHPTLPLCAAANKLTLAVYQRESGKLLADRLLLTSTGLMGAQIEQLWFSPDGASLVLCAGDAEGRFLRTVGLRLSDEEKEIAAQGYEPPKFVDKPVPRPPAVKRSDLEALKFPPANQPERSARQIGQDWTSAVVQIACGNSSGSGFVVGSRGYVLTAAHTISPDEEITITYTTQGRDASRPATIVSFNEDWDLALLKINPAGALKPVALAAPDSDTIAAGEAVTVIGHPGVGGAVLSNTLTTGVVSNAKRDIDGLDYIQTSAAINPGNSGGPMFDSRGQVIGLVSLKARIEGAAFAIPCSRLRTFLGDSVGERPE